MGTKMGYEIVYCVMQEGAGRELMGTKTRYKMVYCDR